MTAIGTHEPHRVRRARRAASTSTGRSCIDKGVEVTQIINHANSLDGGHKPDYDAATDDGDVFIRSMYFKDPNGMTLEFACWTKVLDESDVRHEGARAKTPVDV